MTKAIEQKRKYSFKDYVEWPDNEKWEIIDGSLYNMAPAPGIKHQNIVSNFHMKLKMNPDNPCYTGLAPTDIVFDDHNIVQPDVFLVCEESKITEDNIQGSPDLIIEVVSPSTEVKDRREKRRLYERFGVKEYIIVFPEREYVERYQLRDGTYGTAEIFNWDEILPLAQINLLINLWEIFDKRKEEEKRGP